MSEGPVAGRLRRPGWREPRLVIGLVLIALSVVGVTSVVRAVSTTTPMLEARDTLTPGTVIGPDDVTVVDAKVAGGTYLPADAEPWGMVVTRTIGAGELVPAGALADADTFDGRPVAVRTSLPLAEDIGPGCAVDVYVTEQSDAGARTTQVASSLVVADVQRDDGAFSAGGTETVYVVVPDDEIAELLDALAADVSVSVVGLAGCS